jgi:hypothetical protein
MDYFIADAVQANKAGPISGSFVLSGTKGTPGAKASVGPIKPFKVKWVLPPKTSMFYDLIKSAAEGAGYETVEHDDKRYPGLPG